MTLTLGDNTKKRAVSPTAKDNFILLGQLLLIWKKNFKFVACGNKCRIVATLHRVGSVLGGNQRQGQCTCTFPPTGLELRTPRSHVRSATTWANPSSPTLRCAFWPTAASVRPDSFMATQRDSRHVKTSAGSALRVRGATRRKLGLARSRSE